jgi:hypothetical protein
VDGLGETRTDPNPPTDMSQASYSVTFFPQAKTERRTPKKQAKTERRTPKKQASRSNRKRNTKKERADGTGASRELKYKQETKRRGKEKADKKQQVIVQAKQPTCEGCKEIRDFSSTIEDTGKGIQTEKLTKSYHKAFCRMLVGHIKEHQRMETQLTRDTKQATRRRWDAIIKNAVSSDMMKETVASKEEAWKRYKALKETVANDYDVTKGDIEAWSKANIVPAYKNNILNAIVRITEEARKIRRGRIEAVEDEARLMEAIARRQRATKEVLNGMKELKKDKDDQKKTRVDLLHEAEGMREDKCRDQETRVTNRGSQGIQQRTRAREGESRLKERENLRRQQQGARQMSSPRSRGKIRSRERATRPRTGGDNRNRIPKKKSKWDQKPAQQSSAK